MKQVVVNTLVFASDHEKGMSQLEMMGMLKESGFKKVEVRREYFRDIEAETQSIGEYARIHDFQVFYSVPESLYDQGTLSVKAITSYFKEAQRMSCHHVKMIIGQYDEIKDEDVLMLNELSGAYGINLTVENDQTVENGTVEKIFTFVKAFKRKGGKIGVTFDSGNWIWVTEDPIANAKKLASDVVYIHIKDVSGTDDPQPTFLNKGKIPWKELLQILPEGIPVALEYPMGKTALQQLEQEYDIFVNLR